MKRFIIEMSILTAVILIFYAIIKLVNEQIFECIISGIIAAVLLFISGYLQTLPTKHLPHATKTD